MGLECALIRGTSMGHKLVQSHPDKGYPDGGNVQTCIEEEWVCRHADGDFHARA